MILVGGPLPMVEALGSADFLVGLAEDSFRDEAPFFWLERG